MMAHIKDDRPPPSGHAEAATAQDALATHKKGLVWGRVLGCHLLDLLLVLYQPLGEHQIRI